MKHTFNTKPTRSDIISNPEWCYQGDLAYLKEVEPYKKDLVEHARALITIQDFGVGKLDAAIQSHLDEIDRSPVAWTWDNVCRYVTKGVLSRTNYHLTDDDIDVDMMTVKIGDKTMSPYYDLPRKSKVINGYELHLTWSVPSRARDGKFVGVVAGDMYYLHTPDVLSYTMYKIAKNLLMHEIEEQLMFGGYRLFDPHLGE